MTRTTLLLLRLSSPAALAVGGVAWLLAGLGTFAQAVLTLALVPDPAALLHLGGASALVALGLALPAAGLAGLAAGARRLAEEGGWLGLGTVGLAGRHLLGAAVVWAILAGSGWAALTHVGEPLARAALRDGRAQAVARFSPLPGRTVALGPYAVGLDGQALVFAGGEWHGRAERWALDPARGAVVARLGGVEATRLDGTRVRAEALVVPIPIGGGGGRHVGELATAELRARLVESDRLGRGAYERWILWKRTLLPVLLGCFVAGGLPPALGPRRPGARRLPLSMLVGAQLLSLWGATRVVDQAVPAIGPSGAALGLGAVAAAWAVLPWLAWRER